MKSEVLGNKAGQQPDPSHSTHMRLDLMPWEQRRVRTAAQGTASVQKALCGLQSSTDFGDLSLSAFSPPSFFALLDHS